MCEAEQWEEALLELKRQSYSPLVRQNAFAWRAKIYLGMERYEEVLELEGEARRAAYNLGPYLAVAHARLGHAKEAMHLAEEALRTKQSGAEIAMGHVYLARKEYEQALRYYEIAARNLLDRAAALRAVGNALICLGDYREARVAYEQAIRLTPFVRPKDLLQLAECLRQTHQSRAAAEMETLAHEKV